MRSTTINYIIIQLHKVEYKYARIEYKYFAILYGYLDNWLLKILYCKKKSFN